PPRSSDAYLRFIPRTEMDIAVVGAGVSLTLDNAGTISAARVSLGAVAPKVLLVPEAAQAIVGTRLDVAAQQRLEAAGRAACRASVECGACSVMLDGRLVCSCLVLGCEVSGRRVETIEGMAKGESLHPLQQKFLEHAALQCGICTPGFIVAGKALLERNPNPTETEIRYWLAGNLCRCTGYDKIVSAVKDAAVAMRKG